MMCLECGRCMKVVEVFSFKSEHDDDVDDIYWICTNCDTMCIERNVNGKTYRTKWLYQNKEPVEYTITNEIRFR